MSVRSLITGAVRAKTILTRMQSTPQRIQKFASHDEGPPQPFDNLPFSFSSRYAATFCFSVFFGLGFWAPFLILWYCMAKRSL